MGTRKAHDPATEISEWIKLILMFHFQVAGVQNLVQMTPVQDDGESTLPILALFWHFQLYLMLMFMSSYTDTGNVTS